MVRKTQANVGKNPAVTLYISSEMNQLCDCGPEKDLLIEGSQWMTRLWHHQHTPSFEEL